MIQSVLFGLIGLFLWMRPNRVTHWIGALLIRMDVIIALRFLVNLYP